MCLKLVRCLCLAFPLLLCVSAQRSGWEFPQTGYNGNGYLNGNPIANSFPANQNFGSWGSTVGNNNKYPNLDINSYSTTNKRPSGGNNKKIPTSGNPIDQFTNPNTGGGKNGRPNSWESNKPSKSNSGKWQTENLNIKKEDDKKLAAITNWNSNGNKIPSIEENDNSVFSSLGSAKSPGAATGQMSRPGGKNNWGSDTNEINNWNSRPAAEDSSIPAGNNKWNSISNSGNNWNSNSASNSGQNSRPTNGNNGNSGSNGNSKQTGNDINSDSDYEDNSSWNNNNKRKPTGNSNSGKNTNNNKRGNEKKPTSTSRPSNWDSDSSFGGDMKPSASGNGKTPTNGNTQTGGKPSNLDTSILDELDKNEWYFGRESDYPKPPFKSTLNIDVSELWNFDKNRKPNRNSGGSTNNNGGNNKRRRNRQIGNSEGIQEIQCECVNVNLCDEEDMIITQEDIKSDWRPLEAFQCEELTDVCCTNPKFKVRGRMNIEEEETEEDDEDQEQLRCGQSRVREKIFTNLGGTVAEPGEFPWSLILENTEVNCTASLIQPALALTAAHCVASAQPEELTVTGGVWKLNNEPSQRRRVMKIIPHPGYSSQNPRNDIALLVLEKPFKLTDNVNTICLPVTNDKWDSSECLVAGWNQEEINGEVLGVMEKEVVNFLPEEECQNIMLVTDLWRNYILHDSFVCGVEKNKRETCLGDEGSPVICPSKKLPGTYLQVGIVSKGMNCDNFGRPGIFTNVLQFLDWINQNTFELGLFYDIDVRAL